VFEVGQRRFGFTEECYRALSTYVGRRKCFHLARQENLMTLELVSSFFIQRFVLLSRFTVTVLQIIFDGGFNINNKIINVRIT